MLGREEGNCINDGDDIIAGESNAVCVQCSISTDRSSVRDWTETLLLTVVDFSAEE